MLVSGVNTGDSDDSLTMMVTLGVILAVVLLVIIVSSVAVAEIHQVTCNLSDAILSSQDNKLTAHFIAAS